jgi:hypothetical protein
MARLKLCTLCAGKCWKATQLCKSCRGKFEAMPEADRKDTEKGWGEEKDAAPKVSQFGGNYLARKRSDGNWDIFDVPIMAELEAGANGTVPEDVRKAKLDRIVANHQAKFAANGFTHPFHLEHKNKGIPTRRAGGFLPKRVAQFEVNGKKSWTIFADLVGVHPDAYAEIQQGRWPYVSPEVWDWKIDAITSLSALDDDMPFFEFPMLTIKGVIEEVPEFGEVPVTAGVEGVEVSRFESAGAFRGLVRDGDHVRSIFAFDPEAAKKAKEQPPNVTPLPEGKTAGADTGKAEEKDGEKEVQAKEEVKVAGEVPGKKEAGVEPAGAKAPSPDPVQAMLMAICQALQIQVPGITALTPVQGGQTMTTPNEDPGKALAPAQPPAANTAAPGSVVPAKKTTLEAAPSNEVAQFSARVEALEAERDSRKRADEVAVRVDKAMKDLEGYPQKATLRATITQFAAAGQGVVDAFVAEYKAAVPKDPPSTFASLEATTGRVSTLEDPPEAVKSYFSKGPDHQAAATRLYRKYEELKAHSNIRAPLDRFIALNMESELKSVRH